MECQKRVESFRQLDTRVETHATQTPTTVNTEWHLVYCEAAPFVVTGPMRPRVEGAFGFSVYIALRGTTYEKSLEVT